MSITAKANYYLSFSFQAHCFWFENKQPKELEVLLHALLLDMTKVENAKDVELG